MRRSDTVLTRRDLGLALAVGSAAATAVAQQPPAEDLLASAREQVKRNGDAMRSVKIPTATEPSFTFRP